MMADQSREKNRYSFPIGKHMIAGLLAIFFGYGSYHTTHRSIVEENERLRDRNAAVEAAYKSSQAYILKLENFGKSIEPENKNVSCADEASKPTNCFKLGYTEEQVQAALGTADSAYYNVVSEGQSRGETIRILEYGAGKLVMISKMDGAYSYKNMGNLICQ